MKLHNEKTGIAYISRTIRQNDCFKSVVERWECNSDAVPIRAYLSSVETHATRHKARHYADSMAKYQFRAHCAVYGL